VRAAWVAHHTVSQEGFEPTTKGLRVPCSTAELLAHRQGYRRRRYEAPILKIFVPQTGQTPCVAGRPFFMVICFASLISREALHFTQ
jgi:hypothetical protein